MRLSREDAFTLIELLIVINILGILILIAAPSYLSFKDKAAKNSAMANVRNAAEAASSFGQDNGGFVGLSWVGMKAYNSTLPATSVIGTPTQTSYCIANQVGNWIAYKKGPAGAITTTACTGP